MANQLQIAGAALPASDFAPLHVNRQATGMWPNTNPLRDASTSGYVEASYGGKKDSYSGGTNCEVSPRLTLMRRPGLGIYNTQVFPAITRFYGWNTFTLTTEDVRLMVDTATQVFDGTSSPSRPNTKQLLFTKSAAAGPTYFLGVGNTLYFTNGVDNMQLDNATGAVTKWGIDPPADAPTVSQAPRPNPYYAWVAGMAYSVQTDSGPFIGIIDSNTNIQAFHGAPSLRATGGTPPTNGTTGAAQPVWATSAGQKTADGTIQWTCGGPIGWIANHPYSGGSIIAVTVNTTSGPQLMFFIQNTTGGQYQSGPVQPNWLSGLGSLTPDANGMIWQNLGAAQTWAALGPNTPITSLSNILDPNGYTQRVMQAGKTGPTVNFSQLKGAYTGDGTVTWLNTGPYAVGATAAVQYGYAVMKTATTDISNMSPASLPIVVIEGNQITIQGYGTAQGDTIILYRTAQGGSTFLELARFPNPGAGVQWTYVDNSTDAELNPELQAQRGGEGTPLPSGATCLAYHGGRIYAAVGNVVYVSSGPDAIASGSSGNAGFDTTFTCQSKIIRFWVISLGVVVLTLRDAYIVQGSGTAQDPLYITTWLENLPLLNYDAFAVLLSSAYLFGGQRMVQSLDPGSGITEASFPIAPLANQIDPAKAYLTMHVGGSGETALYLSNGTTLWYRMAPTSAPETGANWSPAATISGGMSALQSVEILPGTMALLVGPSAAGGPIRVRDVNTHLDAGIAYPMSVDYNPIVLANPGQLAGLAWMAIKSSAAGNAPTLGVLLDEIDGPYEDVPRTRQDPTNLLPSKTYLSNRHSLLQNQKPVWCQVIKFRLEWPAEDSPDELLTYTIFGQTWQEQRSQ